MFKFSRLGSVLLLLMLGCAVCNAQSIYKAGQQVGKDIVFNIVEDRYDRSLVLYEVSAGRVKVHGANVTTDGTPYYTPPRPDMEQVKAIAHSVFTDEEIAVMKESGERVFFGAEISQVDGSTMGIELFLNYNVYGSNKRPQKYIFTLPVERFENLYTQLMQLKYKVPPYQEWMTRPYTSMWPIEL